MDVKQLMKEIKSRNKVSNAYMLISVLSGIATTFIVVWMVNQLSLKSLTINEIFLYGGIVAVLQILKAVFYAVGIWQAHHSAYRSLADLRLDIIAKLKKLPLRFFQTRRIGDLTNIVNHDVEQIEKYLAHTQPEIAVTLFVPLVVTVAMIFIDWRLALTMAVPIPAMLLWQMLINRILGKKIHHYIKSTNEMTEDLIEYIGTMPAIKAFSTEEKKTESVLGRMMEYIRWVSQSMIYLSLPMCLIKMFLEIGLVLVCGMGMYLIIGGQLSMIQLVLAILLTRMFSDAFIRYIGFNHMGILLKRSTESIYTVLGQPTMKENPHSLSISPGNIVFEHVDFSYDGKKDVLRNINFEIPLGTRCAVVGSSGSGKTTIANLIMRFWETSGGHVLIGGQDVREMNEQDLNAMVSIVQQESFLFNTSIADNIRLGKPGATLEEIIEACKCARIHDYIASLPEGYDTVTGEGGAKFSGGERQRISIARMMLKNADIVILDEATAAVDPQNEHLIQEAISELSAGKTLIVIAHHLNTIRDFDQIIVLDHGHIAGKGTHENLLDTCTEYLRLVMAQQRADEWNISQKAEKGQVTA